MIDAALLGWEAVLGLEEEEEEEGLRMAPVRGAEGEGQFLHLAESLRAGAGWHCSNTPLGIES